MRKEELDPAQKKEENVIEKSSGIPDFCLLREGVWDTSILPFIVFPGRAAQFFYSHYSSFTFSPLWNLKYLQAIIFSNQNNQIELLIQNSVT